MSFDLSDGEKLALVALLTRGIADDRYPLSPRVRILKDILAKLRREPAPGATFDYGGS
jgi:transposase